MKKFARIAFLVISLAAILEYLLIFGLFTGPLVMALVCIAGIVNIALSVKERNYQEAALYVIATVALSMGYWQAMFF